MTKVGTNSRVDWGEAKRKLDKLFCIAIPAYKEDLTIIEELSLKRLHDTLKVKDNVYLFCPLELNIDKYKEIFPEIKVMEFEPENFVSIDAYSHLCMKYEFYDAFSEYKYMIIYQLDCYLVEDQLVEWCKKGYDYIGAPIVVPHDDWKNYRVSVDKEILVTPAIGNGGFSLRKIETFKYLTNPKGELRTRYNLTDEYLQNVKYEDVYFCLTLASLYEIDRPEFEEAVKFAIDMNPDVIYSQYQVKGLPMCLHAFEKNIPFWRDKIKDFDNDEFYNYCVNKHKDFIESYYFKREK